MKLKIEHKNELQWFGFVDKEVVCEFEYFKDKEGYWINNISIEEEFQRRGYGEIMIKEALKKYEKIFVSTADKIDIKALALPNDLRYVNETYGEVAHFWLFVNRLIEKGILKNEWKKFPSAL